MGCFNSVMFTTPCCSVEVEEQTKSGSCELRVSKPDKVKVNDVSGLSTHIYCTCGLRYRLKHKKHISIGLILEEEE